MRKYAWMKYNKTIEVIVMGGKTSAKSKNTWIAKTYDRINLTVIKGKKDTIQAHADARGESVNAFINRAIDETMKRDTEGKA